MILLSSIWQRQLVSYSSRNVIPVDFAIESFQCGRVDEHLVLGRDSTIEVPPFACRFNKTALGGYLLAIADEDGCVKLLDTRKSGPKSILKEWSAHTNAIFDVAWMEGEEKLVTASGDQTAVLWDACVGKSLATFRGHSCSLKSVNFREGDPFVFTTGARDGNVMIWDMRCNRRSGYTYQPVNTIHNAHRHLGATPQRPGGRRSRRPSCNQSAKIPQQSVTAVVFQGDNMLISAGAVDGNIKMWDLRRSYTTLKQDPVAYHTFPYPGTGTRRHGFSSLMLDSTQSRLFASCTNDNIYMYNCSSLSQKPVCSYAGHLNSTFYVKAALSPDGAYLLSGSSNNDAYIWRVNDPQSRPFVLKGHVGEVTSVAWCSVDQGQLVTCSDDNNFKIWRVHRHMNTLSDKTEQTGHCERASTMVIEPNSPKAVDSSSPPVTPKSSPATSPVTRRTWTPTTRVCTNPRLNPLASPVAMGTESTLKSPESFGAPSPKPVASPTNHLQDAKPGNTKRFFQNGFPSPPRPCPRSPDLPLPSPVRPSSPQMLLKSWLRPDSKNGMKSDSKGVLTTVVASSVIGIQQPFERRSSPTKFNMESRKNATFKASKLSLEHRFKDEAKLNLQSEDTKESLDESPTKSPAAKRRCILGPSNSVTNPKANTPENKTKKCCPTKQVDHKLKNSDSGILQGRDLVSRTENLTDKDKLKSVSESLDKTALHPNATVLEKSRNKENWLTEWSKHLNASSTDVKDYSQPSQSTTSPQCMLHATQVEKQPDVKGSVLQSVTSPRTTILKYFKPSGNN